MGVGRDESTGFQAERTAQAKVHKMEKPWWPEPMRKGVHGLQRRVKQDLRGHVKDSLF